MKNLLILLVGIMALAGSCDHVTVGYLETTDAAYVPDTAVWKAVLDPALPEDARLLELGIPFSSVEIQGVQGTSPVVYSIGRVDCGNGVAEAARQFRMAGSRIQLPVPHTVPPGRYVFSIEVANEGRRCLVDSVFTVILE